MALMTESEVYSDLCLVGDFHGAYMEEELDWLMKTKDITIPGYQSPHIAVRYYTAHKKLTSMIQQGSKHPGLKEFRTSLSIPGVDVVPYFKNESVLVSSNWHWIR